MPSRTRIAESPPAAVQDALERLGRNIRIARLRRRLTQEDLAQRVGVSRFVIAAACRRGRRAILRVRSSMAAAIF